MTAPARLAAAAVVAAAVLPTLAAAQPVEIRIGTVAPARSPWYRMIEEIGQEWKRLTNGEVRLVIFNTVGDERLLVAKMRNRQLQAVAVSGAGMPALDDGISALHMPLLFESYAELDHVRAAITPRLETSLRARGVVVIAWSDVGWVHFFTKTPARTPAELRRLRLFTTAGDAEAESIYKAAGFSPQPLAASDLLPALQTGMIESLDVPPLFAQLNQSFALARHMVDLKWAVLTGATLVDARTWERVRPEWRQMLIDAARAIEARSRPRIRQLGEDAVVEMRRQGLQVIALDPEARRQWQTETEAFYPKLRGTLVPADLFDEVRRVRDEYRRVRTAN